MSESQDKVTIYVALLGALAGISICILIATGFINYYKSVDIRKALDDGHTVSCTNSKGEEFTLSGSITETHVTHEGEYVSLFDCEIQNEK